MIVLVVCLVTTVISGGLETEFHEVGTEWMKLSIYFYVILVFNTLNAACRLNGVELCIP